MCGGTEKKKERHGRTGVGGHDQNWKLLVSRRRVHVGTAGGVDFGAVKKEVAKGQKYFVAYSFFCSIKLSPTFYLTSGAIVRGTRMFFLWEVFSIVLVLYSVDRRR